MSGSLEPGVKGHSTFISLVRELFTPLSVVKMLSVLRFPV